MKYAYKARNLTGALSQGVLEAETSAQAVKKILNDGLVPVEVNPEKTPRVQVKTFFKKGRVRIEDLADFLRRFSDLVEADIPLA